MDYENRKFEVVFMYDKRTKKENFIVEVCCFDDFNSMMGSILKEFKEEMKRRNIKDVGILDITYIDPEYEDEYDYEAYKEEEEED